MKVDVHNRRSTFGLGEMVVPKPGQSDGGEDQEDVGEFHGFLISSKVVLILFTQC